MDRLVRKSAEANISLAERIGLHRMDPEALRIAKQSLIDLAKNSDDPRSKSKAAQFILEHDQKVIEYEHPAKQQFDVSHSFPKKITLEIIRPKDAPPVT